MELFFLGTFAWVDNSWSISGGANLSVDIAKFIQDRFMVGTTHDGTAEQLLQVKTQDVVMSA